MRLAPLSRPTRARLRSLLPLVLVTALGAVRAHAETDERFHVDLTVAKVFDRFQSAAAESAGLSVSSTTAMGVQFDFRVLDIPAGKLAKRPAVHVWGSTLASERTLGLDPAGGTTVGRSPTIEVFCGPGLAVPLDMLKGNAGVQFVLRYEGGYVLAKESGGDFLTLSALVFGFERTSGTFAGSSIELGHGRNETFGDAAAAKRWTARFLLQGRFGTTRGAEPAKPVDAKAAEAEPLAGDERQLRAFLQLDVDTDGKRGPDGMGFRMGLALDAATLFRRAVGVVGL